VSGTYTGGGPAYGYVFTPDGMMVVPEQAALIHEAVKRLARHETIYRIVLDWNHAGITTVSGARWQPKPLRRMLSGEHLTGANGYPPILDEVEAAIVRDALGATERKLKARAPGRRYPLASLLFCSECGTKLAGSSASYRCGVSHGGCGLVSIKAAPLERYVALEGFRHYISGRRSGARAAKPQQQASPDTSPLIEELHAVEQRIKEVASALADPNSKLTVAVASDTSSQLEERRRALMERLARSLPPVEAGPTVKVGDIFTHEEVVEAFGEVTDTFGGDYADESFRERWEARELSGAEVEQLRDLFAEVVERVTVSPRERRGRKFDPSRVEIRWRTGSK
jgi:hypothetical protein